MLLPRNRQRNRRSGYLLAAPVECKPYAPEFSAGQSCRFRLKVNPTKKQKDEGRKQVRRVPLPANQHLDWLLRKAEYAGVVVDAESVSSQRGSTLIGKGKDEKRQIQTVLYEGTLQVEEPETLWQSMIAGIGPSKAFGCGLLSVIPLQGES